MLFFQRRFLISPSDGGFAQIITDKTTAVTELTFIPDGGFLSSHDNKSVITSMYATRSGLIVFTSHQKGDPVEPVPLPRPNAER